MKQIYMQVAVTEPRGRARDVNLIGIDVFLVERLNQMTATFQVPAADRDDDRTSRIFDPIDSGIPPTCQGLFVSPLAIEHVILIEHCVAGSGYFGAFRRNMLFERPSDHSRTAVWLRFQEELRCLGDVAGSQQ